MLQWVQRVVDGQPGREGRSLNLDDLHVGAVNVFCKEPDGTFLGFAGHMASVATAVLLHDGILAARDNPSVSGRGCVPLKLYRQKQVVSLVWPVSCSLLTSVAHHAKEFVLCVGMMVNRCIPSG